MRNRHVPQRTCVICGMKTSKRELVRVVMTPERECAVDDTGKRSGRGAYLCQQPACWDAALRGGRLAAALRGRIGQDDHERLAEFAEGIRAAAGAAGTTG
ncbi:MAG: YlxR family protein [Chloroflexota bacterium]|nr:YlxR family protein [Chloroflexota bacterium]MDE2885065.1 YlxR family protein [Chloroflexota bacterium]